MNTVIESLNLWGTRALDFAWPMLWQSSLLIAALFVFDFILRKKIRAAVRYVFWLVVLLKLLLPPSLALPTGLGWWLRAAEQSAARPQIITVSYENRMEPVATSPATLPFPATPQVTLSKAAWSFITWGGVSAGLLVWLTILWRRVAVEVRHGTPAPAWLVELTEEARCTIGLQPAATVRLTDRVMSPAVCGLWRPVILLPQALVEQLSRAQLRAVLLHELIHLRRSDAWVNCAQTLLQIIYWWHPLAWFANARIRSTREEAVDDTVMLALRDDADTYAPTLLEVAKLAFTQPLINLGLMGILESRHALRQRVERLVNFRAPKTTGLTLVSVFGIAAFTLVAAPMGKAPAPEPTVTRASENAVPGNTTVAGTNFLRAAGINLETWQQIHLNDQEELRRFQGRLSAPGPGTVSFSVEIHGDGTYWQGTNQMDFAELKRRLSEAKLLNSDVLLRTHVAIAAPKPPQDALGKLCGELHLRSALGVPYTADFTGTLRTRIYKVSPAQFMANIRRNGTKPAGVAYQEIITDPQAAITNFFAAAGFEFSRNQQIFFNDTKGMLMIRATLPQLELVEDILDGFDYGPAQIRIESQFVEVPETAMGRVWALLGTNNNGSGNTWTAELTTKQKQTLLDALKAVNGVDVLSAPTVVTLSGRQAQVQMGDLRTVVWRINPKALHPPGVAASEGTNGLLQTENILCGPILDVIPRLGADRGTIKLTVIPTVTEFLGYDEPAQTNRTVYVRGKSQTVPEPKPLVRMRRMAINANVWDEQTLLLGGPMDENRKPAEHAGDGKKRLLVFITPTFIDPAGDPAAKKE